MLAQSCAMTHDHMKGNLRARGYLYDNVLTVSLNSTTDDREFT